VNFYSLEPPLALALSLGWTNDTETANTLSSFYSIIAYTICLRDLFNIQGLGEHEKGPTYVFRGLVCYYGLHYVSIFQEFNQNDGKPVQFLLFDDKNVRFLGDWSAVKRECVKARYQPVLLLYEMETNSSHEMRGKSLNKDFDRYSTQSNINHNNTEAVSRPVTMPATRSSDGESKYEVM